MKSGATKSGAGCLIVGLTGGIGSGKSTVARLFAEHDAAIIDTDEIAHRLTQAEGAAMAAIRSSFGDDYITGNGAPGCGALDRTKMRGLIFSDAAAKQRLENILHPLILEQAQAQMQQLQTRPYIILVVPLLAESPAFKQRVQRVLVVDCDEHTQITRVMARGQITDAEARAIIAQQTPRSERLRLADDVIHNEAGMGQLAEQVAVLHQRYLRNI